jgi:hypothetical protein
LKFPFPLPLGKGARGGALRASDGISEFKSFPKKMGSISNTAHFSENKKTKY